MNKVSFYHWASGMKYPFFYEERGDKLLVTWKGCPRDIFMEIKDEVKGLEDSRWVPEEKIWTILHPRKSLRNANALGYLTNGEIPGTYKDPFKIYFDKNIPSLDLSEFGINYRPYQQEDIEWLYHVRRGLLGADMGLGKTIVALTIMKLVKQSMVFADGSTWSRDDQDNFWMFGPRGALASWARHLKKFKAFQDLRPRLILNSNVALEKAMRAAPHPPIVMANDESANLKNPTAKRTQLMFELSRLMREAWKGQEYIINMTGTPDPKDPTDNHTQIEILCPGFIREKTPQQLLRRLAYLQQEEGAHGVYSKLTGWNTEEVKAFGERLKPIRRRRFKKDVEKQLPQILYERRVLTPDKGLLAAARIAVRTLSGVEGLGVCRQLSDGFKYEHELRDDPEGKTRKVRIGATYTPGAPKELALIDDLEELDLNGETRLILWAGFQESVSKCVEICVEAGWAVMKVDGRGIMSVPAKNDSWCPQVESNFDLETAFQDSNLEKKLVFVGNPDAAGEGLTLTKARTMIFYSNTYRGDKRLQAVERFHRIGMDENIAPRVIDYLHLPTDLMILNNLKTKKDLSTLTSGELLDALSVAELEVLD